MANTLHGTLLNAAISRAIPPVSVISCALSVHRSFRIALLDLLNYTSPVKPAPVFLQSQALCYFTPNCKQCRFLPNLATMSYPMYRVEYCSLSTKGQHSLFIETEPERAGQLYEVRGDIRYCDTTFWIFTVTGRPEDSPSFEEKTYLGSIVADRFHMVESICLSIQPPKKQWDGPRRLYPDQPLRQSREWVNEVIAAFIASGTAQPFMQGMSWNRKYAAPTVKVKC